MGWHSLRRKLATELKHIPLADLCELDGWNTAQTILMCYQQPDGDFPKWACVQLNYRPHAYQAWPRKLR